MKFSFAIEKLLHYITRFHPVKKAVADELHDSFEQVMLPKNECLVREGQVCHYLYFLESGSIRGSYMLEGKEVTYWFGFAPEFVTSFHSFTTRRPAVESIYTLEGCVLLRITKSQLTLLMDSHHEIERLVRIAYENYYIRLEERFVNAQFKPAAERYRQLVEEAPQILEKASLGQVASYLGISQETLSRIRSRR